MSHKENQKLVVLAIGGLDPSGGAGVIMDAAAIRRAGCHPAVIAALLTDQTGRRFFGSLVRSGAETFQTGAMVLADLNVRAMKVGALGSADNVAAVARLIEVFEGDVVLDPVIESTSGGRLLDPEGIDCLKSTLLKRASLVTPNRHEAALLSGVRIGTEGDMPAAADRLLAMGAQAVLVKGGHFSSLDVKDFYMDVLGNARFFEHPRIHVGSVRGTGCALASLIAGAMANGETAVSAVASARAHLLGAMNRSASIGKGIRVLSFGETGA